MAKITRSRKNSPSNPASLSRSLGYLWHCLVSIYERFDEYDDEVQYAWDWQMLHDAIRPESASSLYSGVIWNGLECLLNSEAAADVDRRIIIPEGTRIELLHYARKTMTKYRRIARTLSSPHADLDRASLGVQWNRPEWKAVLTVAFDLTSIEKSIDRLFYILSNCARPSAVKPNDIPSEIVEYYAMKMAKRRRAPAWRLTDRNANDALNLANTETLSSGKQTRKNVVLVTATISVLKCGPEFSTDPIRFALETALRRAFPGIQDRQHALRVMIARIDNLLLSIDAPPPPGHGSPTIRTASETEPMLHEIQALSNDPVLWSLTSLLSRSAQDVETRAIQTSEVDPDLSLLRTNAHGRILNLQRRLERVLRVAGYETVRLKDCQLEWRGEQTHNKMSLLTQDAKHLLTVEASTNAMTVCWETDDSFQGFVAALHSIYPSRYKEGIQLWIRTAGKFGAVSFRVSRIADIVHKLRRLSLKERFTLARIELPEICFWFDPETTPREGYNVLSKVGARTCHGSEVDKISDIFGRTASEWFFPNVVAEALRNLGAKTLENWGQ